MAKVVYRIVRHDGGWAYQAEGVYSETFASHDAARSAAERVAREQRLPGDDAAISFEDSDGHWHEEFVHGKDVPGPTLMMEKKEAGFASAHGDWRYVVVDATVVSDGQLDLCASCHDEAPLDRVFAVPQ